jgi:hypothetical protein
MNPNLQIKITANTAGVDASWWTKGMSVSLSPEYCDNPNLVYAIGDGDLDLSFLELPGLLLSAGPQNSTENVKTWLTRDVTKDPSGSAREWYTDLPETDKRYLARNKGLDAFFEIERKVASLALTLPSGLQSLTGFIDKDGVLCTKGDYTRGQEASRHFKFMGIERGLFRIITGSSMSQNTLSGFMDAYGLDKKNLKNNRLIQANPYIMLCENGAVAMNVLDHSDWKNVAAQINPDGIKLLTQDFRSELYSMMNINVISPLSLHWLPDSIEEGYQKQTENPRGIWRCADKLTMTTLNVPRGIRSSREGHLYRNLVVDCMQMAAEKVGFTYK